MGHTGKDHIYAYEFKEGDTLDKYLKDNYLKAGTNIAALLTPNLLQQLINAVVDCFEALEPYQYIYTDFNTKNMMYSQNGDIVLIDLDSAWSVPHLKKYWNDPLHINDFDHGFWRMWNFYLARNINIDRAAQFLPMTMVLSIAAMCGRAIGYLNQPSPPPDEVVLELVRHPGKDEQSKFWDALHAGDVNRFNARLHIKPPDNHLFEEWRDLFREMIKGRHVTWKEIRQVTSDLALHYPPPYLPPSNIDPPPPGPSPSGPPVSPPGPVNPLPTPVTLVTGVIPKRSKAIYLIREFVGGFLDPFGLFWPGKSP